MNPSDTILNVSGMSCPSCVRHVTAALQALPGVGRVEVQLRAGTVRIQHTSDVGVPALVEALREAGYEAAPRAA